MEQLVVFRGEGIGPEIMGVVLALLKQLDVQIPVKMGGPIGIEADGGDGRTLSDEAEGLCRAAFDSGGVVMAGPGGGRFVYDCRRVFGLTYKVNPIKTLASLQPLSAVDILVIRENLSGLYQASETPKGPDVECRFLASTESVALTCDVAAREAAARNKTLTLVRKEHGTPQTSQLWQRCAEKAATDHDVKLNVLDIDYACYQILRAPQDFDVVVTSNCFGDILADLGGHLMGSRGLTYGASFGADARAIYQTNHGAAWDLAGKNVANPSAQILSLAWMLERSFGRVTEATQLRSALDRVFLQGYRTADLLESGAWNLKPISEPRLVGTQEFGRLVLSELEASRVVAPS